jgi:hypothetical protein
MYLTADNYVFPYSNAKDMHVTQDLNSFREIIAHAQCSVDEKKKYIYCVYHIIIYWGLLYIFYLFVFIGGFDSVILHFRCKLGMSKTTLKQIANKRIYL